MKTFAKYNSDTDRTIAITVTGKTRWITPDQYRDIFTAWRFCGSATFAAMLGGTQSDHKRMFRMFESPTFDYVLVTDDAAFEPLGSLSLETNVLEFHATVAKYAADSRWTRI